MDWALKTSLTFGAVLAVMAAVRWGGGRLGGLAAGLPVITAPTLGWLAHEQGADLAVRAAIGSVASCAMLAAFALAYALTSRVARAFGALMAGLAAAAVLALPAWWASGRLLDALVLAVVCGVIATAAMPNPPPAPVARPMAIVSMIMVSAVAAALSTLAANASPSIGGFATGLVASLPVITGAVAMAEHTTAGHGAARRFLAGYVSGLFGKAMFGWVFALLAPRSGAAMALLLGGAAAASVSVLQWRSTPLEAAPAAVP